MKKLGKEDMTIMLKAAARTVEQEKQTLCELDAGVGDGDHGNAMDAAMRGALAAMEAASEGTELAQLLQSMAWSAMNAAGGATSTLWGSLWLGMSAAAKDLPQALDAADVAKMFRGGLENLRKQTKAQPGDKTMLDALIPAVDAMAGQQDMAALFAAAAAAARKGAEATIPMQARQGRARNLGERTIGHQDAGATSVALIFESFAQALPA